MQRDETNPQDTTPANDADAPATNGGEGDAADVTATDDTDRRLAEQQDRYLRLAAEYDNYRRRTTKERGEAHARGQADLVKQLMDPLDDLMRFAHVDPAVTDATTLVEGVAMIERKVLKVLDGMGLTLVNPVDATFDPTLHEAVATEPAASAEDDDMVARVYQVGYQFNGQLLRPARVVVKQWNG